MIWSETVVLNVELQTTFQQFRKWQYATDKEMEVRAGKYQPQILCYGLRYNNGCVRSIICRKEETRNCH